MLTTEHFRKDAAFLTKLLEKKMAELTPCRCKKGLLFGIEIENEEISEVGLTNEAIDYFQNWGWEITHDNSLRGGAGYEFISSPKTKQQHLQFFEGLQAALAGTKWSNSRRTSTHIHVNVADLTVEQFLVFMSVYWTLEPVLFLLTDKVRYDNTFCISRSIESRDILEGIITNGEFVHGLAEEAGQKYSSMNFAPLRRFGTVECRIFNTTFDKADFERYLSFFEAIYNFALKEQSLADVKQLFIDLPPAMFLETIVGKYLSRYFSKRAVEDKEKIENLIRRGYEFARPIYNIGRSLKELRAGFFLLLKEQKEKHEKVLAFENEHDINADWLGALIIEKDERIWR